jgi:hypothetical protein
MHSNPLATAFDIHQVAACAGAGAARATVDMERVV